MIWACRHLVLCKQKLVQLHGSFDSCELLLAKASQQCRQAVYPILGYVVIPLEALVGLWFPFLKMKTYLEYNNADECWMCRGGRCVGEVLSTCEQNLNLMDTVCPQKHMGPSRHHVYLFLYYWRMLLMKH
jgi:hypothetical protein